MMIDGLVDAELVCNVVRGSASANDVPLFILQLLLSLAPYLTLHPISEENKLPNSCDHRKAAQLGAKRVSNRDHDLTLGRYYNTRSTYPMDSIGLCY
jgi:hypothetical protein